MRQHRTTNVKRWWGVGLFTLFVLFGGIFFATKPILADVPTTVGVNSTTCHTATLENCSGPGWRYDQPSQTVILEDFTGYHLSTSDGDLKIHLKGNNTLTNNDGIHKSLISAGQGFAGTGGLTITADDGATLNINKTSRSLSAIVSYDGMRISGGALTLVQTNDGSGDCSSSSTAAVQSVFGKMIIDGSASLTATAQSCYTGGGIPESILRAGNGIELRTSGNITGEMTSTAGVVDQSRMIALSGTQDVFTNNLIFGGAGTYSFTAPKQVFANSGYGVIGATLVDGQLIQIPAGATFNSSGVLVDAGNNDIRATTNKIICKNPTPTSTVYRFWSNTHNAHFYTISKEEKEHIQRTYPPHVWNYEGVAYQAYANNTSITSPVYRFWSNTHNAHFYTISKEEKEYIQRTYPTEVWNYEGIAWHASKTKVSGSTPLYRFWSNTHNAHFYTISKEEKEHIQRTYPTEVWNYEGIAYYVQR